MPVSVRAREREASRVGRGAEEGTARFPEHAVTATCELGARRGPGVSGSPETPPTPHSLVGGPGPRRRWAALGSRRPACSDPADEARPADGVRTCHSPSGAAQRLTLRTRRTQQASF